MIKRFHSNLIFVKNLEETKEFYDKLGFETVPDKEMVRVKLDNFTFCFIDEEKSAIKDESGKTPKGIGVYFYVEVENVDEYFSFIKKRGIVSRTEPKTHSWGKREFVVKDPNNYKLVFYSSV